MTATSMPQNSRPRSLRVAYPVLAAAFKACGWGALRQRSAILVYQMAKVGSQTIVRSLRASHPQAPVFHLHTLTAEGIDEMERFYRWTGVPALPGAGHLLVSRYLRAQLALGVTPGRWKVITLVRDPIARNLSLLFQLGRRLIPDFKRRCATGQLDPMQVYDRFGEEFPGQIDCMRWFPDELQRVFGIDVFAAPFDRETGFQVYRGNVADVLLLRTEDIDRAGATALREFLELPDLQWRQANIRATKTLGAQYARILRRVAFPRDFVDRSYDSPAVRHFYSRSELDRFRTRWCDGAPA